MGFDLDMTLVDSRPGIVAALDALAAESGFPIDSVAYVARLGPPIQGELSKWFGPDELPAATARFRHFMADFGVHQSAPLPGAVEILALIRSLGGRSIVVTAKHQPLAEATLSSCGLVPDFVVGDLWAADKARALKAHHAVGYFGDHLGDIEAAQAAAVWCVGLGTGGYTCAELLDLGAVAAFESLVDAMPWLEEAVGT